MPEGQRLVLAWTIVLLVVLWSYLWKGIALWHAARRNQLGWYVVVLLAPLFGAVEMFYVFVVAPGRPLVGGCGGRLGGFWGRGGRRYVSTGRGRVSTSAAEGPNIRARAGRQGVVGAAGSARREPRGVLVPTGTVE